MNQEKRQVTLEDLLRLKRAERPAAEFWERFNGELRTKQLEALVDKRPWWNRIPQTLAGLMRYRLPLGATAILALTLVTVREYRPTADSAASDGAVRASVPAPVAVSSGILNIEATTPVLADAGVLPVYDLRDEQPVALVEAAVEPPTASAAGLSYQVSLLGVSEPRTSDFIAESLAATKAAEPMFARSVLGAPRGFEARALPARTPAVEPLAQMASPYEVKRDARVQATVAMINSYGFPDRTGQSVTRQVADERLYDQVRLKDSRSQFSINSIKF